MTRAKGAHEETRRQDTRDISLSLINNLSRRPMRYFKELPLTSRVVSRPVLYRP